MKQIFSIFIVLLFLGSATADARPRGVKVLNGFNGGKSQIQSSEIALGGDYPFINLLKQGTSWVSVGSALQVNGSLLDDDGYPYSLPVGATNINTTIFVPTQASRPGNYVLAWDGNGTVLCTCSDTPVSGSKTSSGGSGRYVFSTTGNQFTVGIVSIGSPRITNMRLYHIDDEPDYLAGNVFGAKFKEVVRATGAGVFRFMDLQRSNFGNVSTWSSRKPVTYVYYAGGEFRSSFYTPTTNSGLVITGTAASGTPIDRQYAQLQWPMTVNNPAAVTFPGGIGTTDFTWTNHQRSVGDIVAFSGSGTPPTGFSKATVASKQVYCVATVVDPNTLNLSACPSGSPITGTSAGSGTYYLSPVVTFKLNSSGPAKYVTDERGNFPIQFGYNSAPTINANATLVYDEGLDLWLKYGTAGTSNTRGYLDNGWPPEMMVQLCIELGMQPYFVLPYLAADAGTASTPLVGVTDWVSSMASLVKTTGPSWMIPHFEGVNEAPWNSTFYGSGYLINKGLIYGWNSNTVYGKAVSTMGQAVDAVYGGGLGTKYRILMGVQTHGGTGNAGTKLDTTAFVSAGGSAAKNWTTHIAVDMYINPEAIRSNQEWLWAWDYVVNGTTQNLTDYVATLDGAGTTFDLTAMNTLYNTWATFAATYTNSTGAKLRLTSYEGGYNVPGSSTPPVSTNPTVTSAITGATQDATGCVLTLATSNIQGIATSGNPAAVGMEITFSSVGGMTELNGLTGTVINVAGNSVKVNIDSSTFSAYTSGGTGTNRVNGSVSAASALNTFRLASKQLASNLAGYTFGGNSGSQSNYGNFVAAGLAAGTVAEFPSQFTLSGSSGTPSVATGAGPNVWGMYDPDIYSVVSPAYNGIRSFNANWLLKRDLDPASNDNSPMWLEKAA